MHNSEVRWSAFFLAGVLVVVGCSEKKVASKSTNQTASVKSESDHIVSDPVNIAQTSTAPVTTEPIDVAITENAAGTDTETKSQVSLPESGTDHTPTQIPIKPKASAKPHQKALPLREADYLPTGVVGLIITHPRRFLDSPLGQLLHDFQKQSKLHSELNDLLTRMQLDVTDIDRATFVYDQASVNSVARAMGFDIPDDVNKLDQVERRNREQATRLKNSLKQVGLGFHNFHDVHGRFPRADGRASGEPSGLSWRVHLLPYMDQTELYNRFHLDESWDSDHNRTLISEMPAVFRLPDVPEEGKTSIHVFTGENTLFHGDVGCRIQDIIDGTSNTILAILAPAEKADVWTKPGGLEVDLTRPRKAIGEAKSEYLLVQMADGAVVMLSNETTDAQLADLIQRNDGRPVDLKLHRETPPAKLHPPIILSLHRTAKRDEIAKAVLNDSVSASHHDQAYNANRSMAVWLPDDQTVVIGPVATVKEMISASQKGQKNGSKIVDQLQLDTDFSASFELNTQTDVLIRIAVRRPILGMLQHLKNLSVHISASGEEGDSLLEIVATATGSPMAEALCGMANMGLANGKDAAERRQLPPGTSPSDLELASLLKRLLASATLTTKEDTIRFKIPITQSFHRIGDVLKSSFQSQAKD